jgi:hypothetical protein
LKDDPQIWQTNVSTTVGVETDRGRREGFGRVAASIFAIA